MTHLFRLVVPAFLGIGFLAALVLWFTIPDPSVPVNVRWRIGVTDAERDALERRFHLTQGRATEGTTRAYRLADYSQANIRALVDHPDIEDTYRLNRTSFQPVDVPVSRNERIMRSALLTASMGSILVGVWVLWGPISWRSVSAHWRTLGVILHQRILDRIPMGFEYHVADAIWAVTLTAILLGIYARTTPVRPTDPGLLFLFGPPMTFAALFIGDKLLNTQSERLSRAHVWFTTKPAAMVMLTAIVATYVSFVYQDAFQHVLFNRDEVRLIDFVHDRSLVASVADIQTQPYFRPVFEISAYIFYHAFGLNHAAYVGAQLFMLGLSAVVLAVVLYRISDNMIISGALSLLFTVHVFVSRVVGEYAIDAITLLGLLAAVVMYLMTFGRMSKLHVAMLLSALLLSFLTRENGLALVAGAACALLVDASVYRRNDVKRAVWLLSGFVAIVAIYFGLRWMWFGELLPSRFVTETCLGSDQYTGPEISRFTQARQLLVVAYTVIAQFTAQAAPVLFDNDGCLQISRNMIQDWAWPGLLIACSIALYKVGLRSVNKKYGTSGDAVRVARVVAASIILCTLAPVMLLWAARAPAAIDAAQALLLLHTFVSPIVIVMLAFQLKHDRTAILIISFCAGILLSTPVLALFYFRYRNLYLPLIAWLALIALCFRQMPDRPGTRRYLLSTATAFLVAMIVMGTVGVREDLPRTPFLPQSFDPGNALCMPRIANDLALQIGRQYGIESKVAQCRAEAGVKARPTGR